MIGKLLSAALLLLSSCASVALRGNIVHTAQTSFAIGTLDESWSRIHKKDAVTFANRQGGAISVDAFCEHNDDVSLDVLTNHLLIGIEHRSERARNAIALDGRAALRTELDVSLDGVPLTIDLVVVKKDGCVYDLQLIAARATFAARKVAFDRFVAGFSTRSAR